MPTPKPMNDLLADLETALPTLGVQLASTLAKVGDPPVYLRSPALRLAQHFDLQADLLIHDPRYGTLGLVHAVEGPDVQSAVERYLDQATYVRHLLLSERKSEHSLPLTVELVLVTRPETLTALGDVLRQVARQTSFLFAIGVNVLVSHADSTGYREEDLRRAFPWLLTATRKWYEEGAPDETLGGANPANPFESLTLQDYRLAGQRSLELDPSSKLHVVYGRNGSGKSSLVEALELAVTGAVERLAGEEDYDRVIRNHGAPEPAQVILGFKGGAPQTFVIGSERLAGLQSDLKATSFRLDQILMDRLTRGGDAQRAEVFLASFFPADSDVFNRYEAARQEAVKSLDTLPPAAKQEIETARSSSQDPEEAVLQKLAWLGEPQKPLSPDAAAACLPLPFETLQSLSPLSTEMTQLVQEWTTSIPTVETAPERLPRIDENLGSLRGTVTATLGTLRMAKEILGRVNAWIATGGAGVGEDFAAALSSWLELTALADLGERHYQILRTLSEARQQGWSRGLEGAVGPFAQEEILEAEVQTAKAQSEEWTRQRDDCFQTVMAFEPQAQTRGSETVHVARLARPQIETLDTAGRWLLQISGTEVADPLGQAIDRAMSQNQHSKWGDVAIGNTGWAQPLLDRLTRLEEACRSLEQLGQPPTWMSGSRKLSLLQDAFKKHQALRTAGQAVKGTFLQKISATGGGGSGLNEALNELMALFTPARWAYEDIALAHRTEAGRHELDFQAGQGARAALRFNTAELNLFTIALFLLCAVRVPNPLQLLVLDDPLQNMDEITVTTLARGLAKVSRLWKGPWQLVLFFHGKEDLERFEAEMPAATYELPWLSPGQEKPGEIKIETRPGAFGPKIQDFSSLASPRTAPKKPEKTRPDLPPRSRKKATAAPS